jgi:hypothetical protein
MTSLLELHLAHDLVHLEHTTESSDFPTLMLNMPSAAYTTLIMQRGNAALVESFKSDQTTPEDRRRILRDTIVFLKTTTMLITMPHSKFEIPANCVLLLLADDHLIAAVITMSPSVSTAPMRDFVMRVPGQDPRWTQAIVKVAFLWAVNAPQPLLDSLTQSMPVSDEFLRCTDDAKRAELHASSVLDYHYARWENSPIMAQEGELRGALAMATTAASQQHACGRGSDVWCTMLMQTPFASSPCVPTGRRASLPTTTGHWTIG